MQNRQQERKIELLPPELRDQIAAGEVVERPASVLKELLENSLDAGADEIFVKVEDGGQSLLSVRDNGAGIRAAELALAVTSHATSKIRSFNDLLRVSSFGFRGEALPSIASVSRLRVTSRPVSRAGLSNSHGATNLADGQDAAFIEVDFGRITAEGPAALPYGTLVEMRDLFSNVPARLKFLKNNATELKRCQEVVLRAALARPDAAFSLHAGRREVCAFAKNESLRQRLEKIWPPQISTGLRSFDLSRSGMRAHGLAGHPGAAQIKADRLLFYVNGRAVSDRLLLRAAREAYKGRLLAREYPQLALFLELDPEEADVNVHPAKSEVRFRDERAVFGLVLHAVESALDAMQESFDAPGELPPVHASGASRAVNSGNADRPAGFWGEADRPRLLPFPASRADSYDAFLQPSVAEPAAFYGTTKAEAGFPEAPGLPNQAIRPDLPELPELSDLPDLDVQPFLPPQADQPDYGTADFESDASTGRTTAGIESDQPSERTTAAFEFRASKERPASSELPFGLNYLGQAADTYLIVLRGEKLLLLDQHAVHERILMHRFSREAGAGQAQLLALPLDLQLHPAEAERLQQLWGELAGLGFSLKSSGASLQIMGIPPLLDRAEARDFLRAALAGRGNGLRDLLTLMACKGAIKAGQKLTRDEALGLIQQWLDTPDREFCPHGRPAVLTLGADELEKMFKRK
ncbi:MAG: DNA mismatch repair endonuclease MutL [Deltaproteobacteria bacterium]|jgi:DNA mismatch repair protein MutL|nr:DNA mismatch repair endonuclease MutL [Deltaproteobacteria bacterium]